MAIVPHVSCNILQGSKILLLKESTCNVVLKAVEIRGDELCHKGIYYLFVVNPLPYTCQYTWSSFGGCTPSLEP